MNQEAFDRYVKKLEASARKSPKLYKFRVGLLATLGYIYIVLVLTILLAIITFIVLAMVSGQRISTGAIKLIILLLIPAFFIVKSLFIKFPKPSGLEVRREKVPHLFNLIDKLTKTLATPRFHRVLLVGDFNAYVSQHPRLGIFGWHENYLIIGLPLMQALTRQQFEAVLAHEFGHLSGNHSRFGAWIYRQRRTWEQIWEQLSKNDQEGSLMLFKPFLNWYFPFFNAYSFVLARRNEYEADYCAVQVAGVQSCAEALVNTEVAATRLNEEFWPQISAQMNERPEPPSTVFTALGQFLAKPAPPEKEQQWLQLALALETNSQDTHPCLRDRLQAVGYSPEAKKVMPVKQTAAQELLGGAVTELTRILEEEWQTNVRFQWHERYTYVEKLRTSLQKLLERAKTGRLSVEEAWNRVCWTLELEGNEAAMPLIEEVLQLQADFAPANYLLGSILLGNKDQRGINYIEAAIAKDMSLGLDGYQLIYQFWQQQGNLEKAKACEEQAIKDYKMLTLVKQERSKVTVRDSFESHGLPTSQLSELRKALKVNPQIKEAYFLRKVVQHLPEKPLYILAIVRQVPWYQFERATAYQEFVIHLLETLPLPSDTVGIWLRQENWSLRKVFRKIPDALIVG